MSTIPSSDGDAALSLPVLPTEGGGTGGAPRLKRSKAIRWRTAVLILVHVIMIAHFVQWYRGGETISPIEPSESMELVKRGVINAGFVFFSVALLSTLIFGRFFCGWGCHVIALQDLCYAGMMKLGIRPKPFRSRLLVYVPFVLAVYMFVWPAVYRWGVVPLSSTLSATELFAFVPDLAVSTAPWPGISTELTTEDFWATFPGVFVAIPFFLVCGFATVYFLGAKGFCTYGCPYGGFFAPVEQYAPGRIRVNEDCEQTGHCTAACTSNVRVHDEVREYGMVIDPGCMKCMDCVSVCPNTALSFSFGRPAAMKPEAKTAAPKRVYDLTVPEEIAFAGVFLGSFLSVRGLYEVIPMLMAAGVAGCITFILWKGWRVLRDRNASFHRWRLRFHGKLTGAGRIAIAVAVLTLLITIHSGAVQSIRYLAGRADGDVTIPRQLVFSASPRQMPPEMAARAATALRRYTLSQPFWRGGIALAPWAGTDVRMAWLEACGQNFDAAATLMTRHLDTFGPADLVARDVLLLRQMQMREGDAEAWGRAQVAAHPTYIQTAQALVGLMSDQGRAFEAAAFLDEIMAAQPPAEDLSWRERGTRLNLMRVQSLAWLQAGDRDKGISITQATLEIDPTSIGGWTVLARALGETGRTEEAIDAMMRAIELREASGGGATIEDAELLAELYERGGAFIDGDRWRQRAAALRAAAAEAARAAGGGAGAGVGAGSGPVRGPAPSGPPAP